MLTTTGLFRMGLGLFLISSISAPLRAGTEADDQAQCAAKLKKIYQAIQQYRRDHKSLPNWLSDLAPDYISDPELCICPVQLRTGRGRTYDSLADPRMKASYTYEFCAKAVPADIWGGDKEITMQTWKSLQMAVLGGKVPLLRCFNHPRPLNLGCGSESATGRFFETGSHIWFLVSCCRSERRSEKVLRCWA